MIFVAFLVCIPTAAAAPAQNEANQPPAPSYAMANSLQSRLKEMLASHDEGLVESFNDWFYALNLASVPVVERRRALNLMFDRSPIPNYSEWLQLRPDYLLHKLKMDSLEGLELLKNALKIGTLELLPCELDDFADQVIGMQATSTSANVLRIQVLTAISSRLNYAADLRRKWAFAALKIGIEDKSISDKLLNETFNSFLATYYFPNAPPSYYDARLPQILRALAADATPKRKHEFIVNCSFDELRNCADGDELIATTRQLAEKMEAAGAEQRNLVIFFCELGFAQMLKNNFVDAISPLKHAESLIESLPDFNEYRVLIALSIAECYRRQGRFSEASTMLGKVDSNEEIREFVCLDAHAKTGKALLLRHKREYQKAMELFKAANEWYARHPGEAETGTYAFRYLGSMLPGEIETLDNMAELHEISGRHHESIILKQEKEKVLRLREQNRLECEQSANKWSRTQKGMTPDKEVSRINAGTFNAKECSRIVESLQGRRLPEDILPRKFELLDYSHALVAKNEYSVAQKVALMILQGRDESSIEAGSLLAYCYAQTGHKSLAETTMSQALHATCSWFRPQADSPLFCRNQAYFYYYAILLLEKEKADNPIRLSRYHWELQRWISQPAIAASPFAAAQKQSAQHN